MPRKRTSKRTPARPRRRAGARRPSATRSTTPARAARPKPDSLLIPLTWRTASPQHRTAAAPGGIYVAISFDSCVTWSAEWRPTGGKATPLAFRQPLAEAQKACETHRKLVDANKRLVAGGHEALTERNITDEPVAWKRGRR